MKAPHWDTPLARPRAAGASTNTPRTSIPGRRIWRFGLLGGALLLAAGVAWLASPRGLSLRVRWGKQLGKRLGGPLGGLLGAQLGSHPLRTARAVRRARKLLSIVRA